MPTHENDNQYVGKVDYQRSSRQSFFIRTVVTHISYPPALGGCKFDLSSEKLSGNCVSNNMLNSTQPGENQLSQSDAVGHTFVINNNMVNSFRVAFNRTAATLSSANLFTRRGHKDMVRRNSRTDWYGDDHGGVAVRDGFG